MDEYHSTFRGVNCSRGTAGFDSGLYKWEVDT